MDITINVEDYKLNVRAAGIIIHNNKVLLHKNVNTDYYALIGGRVKIGENSAKTIIREIKEELGKDVEIEKYAATVENFFQTEKAKYHEILFSYKVEFIDDEYKKIQETLKNIEGKENLQYEWIDIDKLDQIILKPEIMKKVIKENKFPVHEIQED